MPSLKLTVPAELYEAIQRLAAINELSLSDIGRVLLEGGLEEQGARSRD